MARSNRPSPGIFRRALWALGRGLRFIAKLSAVVVSGGVTLAACFLVLALAVSHLPNPVEAQGEPLKLSELAQRTEVYDRAGNLLGVIGDQDRRVVGYDQLPPVLINAVLSVEDRGFWNHMGINVRSIVRAMVRNSSEGKAVQGGSTITQQLIKNRVVGSQRTMSRKIEEAILALRLEKDYSKEEILTEYMNTVYFGEGSYGAASAAERMFGVPLQQLDVAQAALLAGVIAEPETANPFLHPQRATSRRQVALDAMVRDGYITQDQATQAAQVPLPTKRPQDLRPRDEWVQEAQTRLLTDPMYSALGVTVEERRDTLLQGGLRIELTKDPVMQDAANQAVERNATGKEQMTAALTAVEPGTGAVRAMVANRDYQQSQYNLATSYPGRQAGSTWKIITLATALQNGWSPVDLVNGSAPCQFMGAPPIFNSSEGGGGSMTLQQALTGSVNCAWVRVSLGVGLEKVIDTAYKLGVTQRTLHPVVGLTLGAIETSTAEMANVGATIANGGQAMPLQFVQRITRQDGTVLFDMNEVRPTEAIGREVAACVSQMATSVVQYGTGTAARLDRPVAGKTGTTDDLVDANFLGWTPQLAAFVWYGNPQKLEPGAGFGGEVPARVFHDFMQKALDGQDAKDFPSGGDVCTRSSRTVSELGRPQK